MIWNNSNCLHHNSAVPQPFLLLIAAKLAQFGFLGWKLSLWPRPTWIAVHRSKAVFFLTLYDNINHMKYFWNFCITPQPCYSHFYCWLLPIWPKLNVWSESGAYDLCRLGWRYNGVKLSFSWPYMIVWMIWNTSELSALHLSRATVTFVDDCCHFGPSSMFRLEIELRACADLVCGITEQRCLFYDLISYFERYETLPNCLYHTSSVLHPFLISISAN